MTQLRKLHVASEVVDITPVAQLTQLTKLVLGGNDISDISPLAQLTQLTFLVLGANQIADITPLTGLTRLRNLFLEVNQINELAPLAHLKQLTLLYLSYNEISILTPLAELADSLTELHLDHNEIQDITPLGQLVNLEEVHLSDNQIRDVTPLKQLADASLRELDLRDNQIGDVSPLASLVYLEELKLRDNPITDTTPLRALLNENPNLDIDIEVAGDELGPTVTASTSQPLAAATLDGSVVTLTLNGRTYETSDANIRGTVTVSGVAGVTVDSSDIDRESDTEVTVELTFDGSINTDTTLTFTVGAEAIENYDGSALTAHLAVSASTEPPDDTDDTTPMTEVVPPGGCQVGDVLAPGESCIYPGADFTFSVLDDGKAQLKIPELPAWIDQVSIGGSLSITATVNDENYHFVAEEVSGDSWEIKEIGEDGTEQPGDGDGTPTLSISTASPLTEGTLDERVITLTLSGATFERSRFTIRDAVTVSGIAGVTIGTFGVDRVSDTEVTVELTFDGNINTDSTLTFTVGATAIENYDGSALTADIQVSVGTETPPQLKGDVTEDGVVNILDLVRVASSFGKSGEIDEDVNGDGIVNILDLVLVAGALGDTAAAPSANPRALAMLTAKDVGQWLAQAQEVDLMDATSQRGVLFLEQLFAPLTPKETALLPNYPNPFNPETWIPYQLAEDAFVTLTIYDGRGRAVRTLEIGHRISGFYEDRSQAIYWDGRNDFGEGVASGVYFYHLSAGDYSATRKMLIIK